MIRLYDELTRAEKDRLAEAWVHIAEALNIYEQITGASDLDDVMYTFLWDSVEYQKNEEA